MYSWKEFLKEAEEVDLDSFKLQNNLNQKIWDFMDLKPQIREKLIKIATNFFIGLGFPRELIDDITFTGSLANYNWSRYSDIDLHLLVDFTKVDENVKLVGEFFRAKTSIWNRKHNIKIRGYEVELYVQDSSEPHISTGVFSVKNDAWNIQPTKEEPEIDMGSVQIKATSLMDQIDRIADLYDDEEYKEANQYAIKLKNRIKDFRRSGLSSGGQYSVENIVFKVLRRNGALGQLFNLITDSYDKMMSMDGDFGKKLKIFVKKGDSNETSGFNRMIEEDKLDERGRKRDVRRIRHLRNP
tara:strand:+ start:1437 stop:2330 length:894 start_codon:yes stop_codon:yes gene_type:complete